MSRIGDKSKSYGLIIPGEEKVRQQQLQRQQQQQQQKLKRPSVFDEDGDTDSDDGGGGKFDEKFAKFDARKAALEAAGSSRLKSATRVDIDKCLAEDPSIFEYDAIYDKISERQAAPVKTVRDRAPKYISGLVKAAGARQMEREYQKERKIQVEREAEGEKFADKEAFVTSAYKRRLAEFESLERQHRLQELKDARQDAAKREDLSGFYRNLLDASRLRQPGGEVDDAESSAAQPLPSKVSASASDADRRRREQQQQQQQQRRRQQRHRPRGDRRSRSRSASAASSAGDSAAASPPRGAPADSAVLDPLLLVKLRRRNDTDAVSEARRRYLERKSAAGLQQQQQAAAPPIVADSDDSDAG